MQPQEPANRPIPAAETARADGSPRTRFQKFRIVVKVVELRLRFVALMAVTGLTFAYWDTIWNRYDKWMRPANTHASASGIEFYCPMHPQVVQDDPGSCPICGMPLARRLQGEKTTLAEGVTARVQLSPRRVAQAGIRTAEVAYAPMRQTLTTVGIVALDERRLATIPSKVVGKSRVETLRVNFSGMEVAAGEELAELYSPELYQAISELLTASTRAEQDSTRVRSEAGRALLGDRRELVRLSAEKLKRWGITQGQIDAILKSGVADFKVPILAPISGTVIRKNVVQGQEVQEGFPMFEIADLTHVWVLAQVYENQIGLVREGQVVKATVDAYPGEEFPGRVDFLQPTLDPATRTVEVRFDLENKGGRLRPGMFATVALETPVAEMPEFRSQVASSNPTAAEQEKCPVTNARLGSMGEPIRVELEGRAVWTCCAACPPKLRAEPIKYLARLAPAPRDEVLSVPESAVIDTGVKKVVYVEAEPGVFEGREVVLGNRVGDRYPVLDGLLPGEKVAARGAFLIDAESRLNPSPQPAASPEPPAEPAPPADHDMPARSASASTRDIHRR